MFVVVNVCGISMIESQILKTCDNNKNDELNLNINMFSIIKSHATYCYYCLFMM